MRTVSPISNIAKAADITDSLPYWHTWLPEYTPLVQLSCKLCLAFSCCFILAYWVKKLAKGFDTATLLQALSALIQPQIRVVQAAPVSPNLMDEAQHKAVCDVNNIEGPKEVLATTAEKSQGLSSEALQQIVLQTGVIDAVLQAVEDSAVRCMSGNIMTRR